MQKIIFIFSSLIVFAVLNYSIVRKESLKSNGTNLLLPVKAYYKRSMLQGDSMRLEYDLENQLIESSEGNNVRVVLDIDDNHVGKWKRFHDNEPLEAYEKLLQCNIIKGKIDVLPNAFMMQEGYKKLYEKAKYAVFKADDEGNAILVGLANQDQQLIDPQKER